MVAIAEPIKNIGSDSDFIQRMKTFVQGRKKEQPVIQVLMEAFGELLPHLIQNHKKDLYAILSAFTGKPEAEIAEQPFSQTYAQFYEIFGELAEQKLRKAMKPA